MLVQHWPLLARDRGLSGLPGSTGRGRWPIGKWADQLKLNSRGRCGPGEDDESAI
jgi:hypothetical protein